MTNKSLEKIIKKNLRNLSLGLAGASMMLGLSIGFSYTYSGLKRINEKIENSEYIKNYRKEQEDKKEFQEKYLNAVKNNNITYTHCGNNLPLWFVDIDRDKISDGYLLHINGSTRGSNGVDLYKIKK